MKQSLTVRCVGRNEELMGCYIMLDPTPDQPPLPAGTRGFWLSMTRGDAYQFEVGRLYELSLEGPKAEPE